MAGASGSKAKLWLHAFGVGGLGRAGETKAFPLGMKALAMLVYLAEAAPRPVSRDALVELLWERVAPAQGKASLRQEIRRLKRALGEDRFDAALHVTDQSLTLRLDAVAYDGAAAVRAVESDDPDEIATLMTICEGDFLASNAARAATFQQWALERREFLSDTTLAALARLGFMDVEGGRLERAQAVADRIAQIDPLHEKGAEIMIRAHLASGRRSQARAHFERFRKLMLRELGAEPDGRLASLVSLGPGALPGPARPGGPRPEPRRARRGGDKPVVAVLNASPRGEDATAYLAEGMTVQLVSNLSRSSWIKVTAPRLPLYAALAADVDRYQRDLRETADYVLRVDVRAAAKRVAITASMSRMADEATVFTDQMEDDVEDILGLQRRVALRIASVFEPALVGEETRLQGGIEWDDAPDDINHWRLLMRANWLFWSLTPRANAEAKRLLARALEIRPGDTPTLCMMAFAHMVSGWSDWTDDVDASVREARRWAEKAVREAPNDGWSQFAFAISCSTADRLGEAKGRLLQALRLAPALVIAVGELARIHAFAGETEAAKARADEALALSPYDMQAGLWIRSKAIACWIDGELEAALELIDYGIVVRPGWFQNDVLRAVILAELGRLTEARAAFAAAEERVGPYSLASLKLGHPFADRALLARFIAALNQAGGDYRI